MDFSMSPDTGQPDDVTAMLDLIGRGEASPDELLPVVYRELRALAGSVFRGQRADHTLQPTALVHEVYVRLVDRATPAGPWEGRRHFFAVAAKAMRQILINHAEKQRAAKRGGDWQRVTLAAVDTPGGARDIDLLALDEALTALERLDERQCRIVELRYFAGLTVEETAEVLEVSPRTVQLDWRMARVWLQDRLEA